MSDLVSSMWWKNKQNLKMWQIKKNGTYAQVTPNQVQIKEQECDLRNNTVFTWMKDKPISQKLKYTVNFSNPPRCSSEPNFSFPVTVQHRVTKCFSKQHLWAAPQSRTCFHFAKMMCTSDMELCSPSLV